MHYAWTSHDSEGVDDRLDRKDPVVSDSATRNCAPCRRNQGPNFRIFADRDGITVLNNERMIRGTDIQEIFSSSALTSDARVLLGRARTSEPCCGAWQDSVRRLAVLGYLSPPDETNRTRRLNQPSKTQENRRLRLKALAAHANSRRS